MKLKKHNTTLVLGAVVAGSLLSGCNSSSDNKKTLDNQLSDLISQHGLTGDPSTGRSIPSIGDKKAQLGKALFFQPYSFLWDQFVSS